MVFYDSAVRFIKNPCVFTAKPKNTLAEIIAFTMSLETGSFKTIVFYSRGETALAETIAFIIALRTDTLKTIVFYSEFAALPKTRKVTK